MYLAQKAQITLFIAKKVTVPAEYTDFINIFSKKLVKVLFKETSINMHTIKLVDCKQLSYGVIYSLVTIKFEKLKIYIKTNLINEFIWPSKSLAGTLILFVCKFDESFHLCVYYQEINNSTIKNWYPLSLIDKLLNWLKQAKRFIQLNLTNAYY